jgi:uncharacterized membrane protein
LRHVQEINMNKNVLLIIFIAFFAALSFCCAEYEGFYSEKTKALIIEEETRQSGIFIIQNIKAKIVEGPFKNHIIYFRQQIIEESPKNFQVKKNMKVFIDLKIYDGKVIGARLVDVVREDHIKILFGIFFSMLILFGGFKGFRSFIALLVTALCILYFLIPMVTKGRNLILSTVLVSTIIVITSFIIISGFTRKSLCAVLGTIGGTMVSGILAIYFGNKIYLSGISDEMNKMLGTYFSFPVDYRGLLYCGIIIGVLGAAMDVSMTITSVVYEIKRTNPNVRRRSLFFSGLSVGKDIMATMTNTLILAYVGTSLPLFLLFIFNDMSFLDIINSQYIASEIIRSLCGSIGLVLTIPITSVISALST